MDLKKYNPNLTIDAKGLKNTGVLCYFNSLIQSLLSCTSFIQTVLDVGIEQGMDKDKGHNHGSLASNELWQVLFFICNQITEDIPKWSANYSVAIWRMFMKEIKKQKKQIMFGKGQEDTHEALLLFLDCLESKNHTEISKLFQHRYRHYITCPECKHRHEAESETGSIRMISYVNEKDSTDKKLIDFLRSHKSMTDENHICENCNFKGIKKMQYSLTMLPEIFIILFKKYDKKWQSNRPETLAFTTLDKHGNKDMNYQLVSQIEHSGGQGGGHYWARSLRKDGVNILNDMQATHEGPWQSGEPNVYVAFYHYIGLT
jgi:ubiquitin C-terminal hydrolase